MLIRPPGNLPVRPTTDFAKTGLFNLLENRFQLKTMDALDLFCGTGSISFELVSRGCTHVTAIDQEQKCITFIKSYAQRTGMTNLSAFRAEVLFYLKKLKTPYSLIFADPPFGTSLHEELHNLIWGNHLLKDNGIFVMEHSSRSDYSNLKGFDFSRNYGNVVFSFFKFVPTIE